MYAASESGGGLVLHSGTIKQAMSPSHPTNGVRPSARHLVDLSSGSTCCSSSTSSSPHTLMQGPPPVPTLPASITQGVMLFAPGELSAADHPTTSPSHYATQYATHQFHPYLNSSHSATLPRHYDANTSLAGASPLKLYSEDQLVVRDQTLEYCQQNVLIQHLNSP